MMQANNRICCLVTACIRELLATEVGALCKPTEMQIPATELLTEVEDALV